MLLDVQIVSPLITVDYGLSLDAVSDRVDLTFAAGKAKFVYYLLFGQGLISKG